MTDRPPEPQPRLPRQPRAGHRQRAPEQVVTNDDLSKIMETNDEWIRDPRRDHRAAFAETDELLIDFAVAAGTAALADAGSTRPKWTR